MKSEIRVYLIGFVPFEKATFESFFKLVGARETQYKIVADVLQAQLVMVNSDNVAAVNWANASISTLQKALFIGAPDSSDKWPSASRPIKLTTVLGLLDVLMLVAKPVTRPLGLITTESTVTTPPVQTTPSQTAFKKEPARMSAVRQGSGNRDGSDFVVSNFMGLGTAPSPASSFQQFDDILVVDDSDIALRFMQNRLTRYGFRTELVSSGEEALKRVATKKYKFVFLDVMMQGLDGYQTCRAIKQRKNLSTRVPVVVMLTSRGGSIDKIRGGLAGCDAYLTKPLNEAELLKVLSKHDDQVERSFRDTNIGGSGLSSLQSNN